MASVIKYSWPQKFSALAMAIRSCGACVWGDCKTCINVAYVCIRPCTHTEKMRKVHWEKFEIINEMRGVWFSLKVSLIA